MPISSTAASVSMRKGMGNSFFAVSSLFTKPGYTQVTRTPVPPRSTRRLSMKVARKALEAE